MKDIGLKKFNKRITILLILAGLCMLVAPAMAEVPSANYTAIPRTGGAPLTVTFTDSSTGSPESYLWTFGDGCYSDTASPSHAYNSTGTYSVTLHVNNTDGSDDETKSGYITVLALPVIDFTGNPTSGNPPPYPVLFTGTYTGDTPDTWSWNFGDGCYANTQSPTHAFNTSGQFTITLTATNAAGSDTETKSNYINITYPITSAPVASFTANVTTGTAPLAIRFTSTSTNSPTTTTWYINGSTAFSSSPYNKTFTTAGNYTVRLYVANAYGSSTTLQNITVSEGVALPVASFYANVTSGSPPLIVKFFDTSSNSPVSWHWVFGTLTGVNTSSEQNPTFTYSTAGYYNVTLTAYNSAGNDIEEKVNYIYVGTAATTATTATPTPTPTPTATAVLPQMTAAFTPATEGPTTAPTSAAFYDGILTETLRINSVIEELVKLFKNMIGLGNSAAS